MNADPLRFSTRSEMAVGSNLLESGEMMLARMVEERDNDKLELFLQEMEMVQTKVPGSILTWWVVVIVKRLDSRVLPALVVSNNLIIPEFEKEN